VYSYIYGFSFTLKKLTTFTVIFHHQMSIPKPSDWLERLVPEMTYYVSRGTLNSTHSHSATRTGGPLASGDTTQGNGHMLSDATPLRGGCRKRQLNQG